MTPEKLEAVRIIVVHDSCPDGTASAIILKDALPKAQDIRFVQYGTEAHKGLVAEPGMLFCDITPPPDRADEFVAVGALVLDHHKTARATVAKFGENGVFADEAKEPGVCGAVLAYREVWMPRRSGPCGACRCALPDESCTCPPEPFVTRLATLAGIRDTWQRQDSRWNLACQQANVLRFIPNEKWMAKSLREIAQGWERDFAWLGQLLEEKNIESVKSVIERGWKYTSQWGTRILMIPSTHLTSDAAEALGDQFDIIVGFGFACEDGKHPVMTFSTRSHTTFDCSALARHYGGGGHTKAAGFARKVTVEGSSSHAITSNPYDSFVSYLEAYEMLTHQF